MEGAGILVFATSEVDLDSEDVAGGPGLKPGRYVRLQVVDNGGGMEPAVMERAFDPFYTTKPPGKGTGLGLSMVYGTISNHGGMVRLSSSRDRGTTVSIFLPVADPQPPTRRVATGEYRKMKNRGTLLLVDDEKLILIAGKRAFGRLGYNVFTAEDGASAIAQYRTHGSKIDLVVLDLSMPVMDGVQTFQALRGIDPDVKVLISSGHFREDRAEEMLSQGALGFLQKPFTLAELSRALGDILQEAPVESSGAE
jgi:CheY-like chemotaxis protein